MATTKLTYKETEYEVADLPNHVQQVIACYDEADARYHKAEMDLIIASSSKKYLTSDISKFIDEWLNSDKSEDSATVGETLEIQADEAA